MTPNATATSAAAQLSQIRYQATDKNGKALTKTVEAFVIPRLGESVYIEWGEPIGNESPSWRVTGLTVYHNSRGGQGYASASVELEDTHRSMTVWKRRAVAFVGYVSFLACLGLVAESIGMGFGKAFIAIMLAVIFYLSAHYTGNRRD